MRANIFQLLSRVFKKANVTCILIGGFALNYYRVSRQTADIDFLIGEGDFEKVLPLLKKSGFSLDYRQEVFSRLVTGKDYLMDVDFLFVDSNTLSIIQGQSNEVEICKNKFKVPSLFHLIALKLHAIKNNPSGRLYRDLTDIIDLIRVNKVDFKSKRFKELCLKYGTQELYKTLLLSV